MCVGSLDEAIRRPVPAQQAIRKGPSRLAPRFLGAFEPFSVNHGRTPPRGLFAFIAPDPHAGSGGGFGRRSSIRRRMLANSDRGTATSASWTPRSDRGARFAPILPASRAASLATSARPPRQASVRMKLARLYARRAAGAARRCAEGMQDNRVQRSAYLPSRSIARRAAAVVELCHPPLAVRLSHKPRGDKARPGATHLATTHARPALSL